MHAQRRSRGDESIGDIVAMRSDAVPGRYTCVECGAKFANLQEAWRDNSGLCPSLSALFCEPCAMRVRAGANLPLEPIRLGNLERLNNGEFVPEFGVLQAPQQLKEAAAQTPAQKWQGLIDK